MTRALIFGLGGVGCIYGYILEQGGVEVTAVCRSNYEQVKANGVILRSAKWGTVTSRPYAARSPKEAALHGPFDYILICSKAFPGTSELIRDAVTEGTAIVLAQNGIGIEDEYAAAYPSNTIISGVVYLPTTQVEPGVVEHGTPLERLEIGTYPADAGSAAKDAAAKLAALFTRGGGTCITFDDVQAQRWEKLSVNASLNPITALSLCDDANFLRSSPGALEVAKDVMREVGAVAAAHDYHGVDKDTIDRHMLRHEQRVNGKEPSMLVDVRQNRPVEVEAILGNAVRLAEKQSVAVPYLRMLYTLTKARNFAIVQSDEWKPIARVS
nr:hypothetical protein B0A51_13403 [Rachicladosporium sp. CCFEE 5018]